MTLGPPLSPVAGSTVCKLTSRALVIEGTDPDGAHATEIDSGISATFASDAPPEERTDGWPTVMLERSDGGAVRISSVAQPGIVAELAERLAALHFERELSLTRVAVIVPLVEGAGDRARALLAAGPPFDPATWEIEEHLRPG